MFNVENLFEGEKVVIVGGAGFVGSNLTKMILNTNKNVKVIVIDNLMSAEKTNLPDDARLTFLEGSVTSDAILAKLDKDITYAFQLATYHGNQSSIHDPIADHENNTFTSLKFFDYVKDFKSLKKVVYSSAGCSVAKKTFDTAEETTEDAPIEVKQDSPYSMSKIFGEFYCVYYFNQHQLPTVRARFQNVYGPGEVLGAGQWRGTPATVWRNVTPTFVYKALNNIALPLENNGIASRDFIFVTDICRGLIACAIKGAAGDVYNIGSGREIPIGRLAELINEYTGNKGGIEHLPKRPWDNSGKRFASIKKSEKELGFKAEVAIEDGIKTTVEWTKQNLDLINKTIAKHKDKMPK